MFASTAENLVGFAGPPTTKRMDSESAEDSRSGHGSKVFGNCTFGYDLFVPEAVIDQVQAYHIQKQNVKEVQAFVRILGYGEFIPHLAQCLCPLHHPVKEGYIYGIGVPLQKQKYWSRASGQDGNVGRHGSPLHTPHQNYN